MHIAIDASCWSNQRGFGRFTRELVTHMVQGFPEHRYTLVLDAATAAGSAFPRGVELAVVSTDERQTAAASAEGSRSPRDVWRMSRAASRLPVDAFFFPAVYSFYPLLRKVPTVVTFHDAIAESHPDLIFPGARSRLFWNAKTWLARRQATRLLTVSENARQQVMAAFGEAGERIRVISEAPSSEFRPVTDEARLLEVRARYSLPAATPLLLAVGGISPHKNLQGLIQAAARLPAGQWHLALVGDHAADGFHACYDELVALRSALGLDHAVTFTGFVPNDDLVALYGTASALVLPSFSEGFGLPAVEAMACGLPVAASAAGSLPEVLGSAGLLFDPHDTDAIAGTLSRLLGDAVLRTTLREAGLVRARDFSWPKAARDTIRVFEEIIGGASA